MINIKNVDLDKIKIDEKSYKNIPIYYIGHVSVKNLSHIKNNSVSPLYLFIDKINGQAKESNRNKYLMLVPTDESKDILEKYEKLWNKIRGLVRSKINNSDSQIEKYMKMKFISNDGLTLKKTCQICFS